MNRKLRANLLLILTAMIWGAAFVAQDVAGDVMEAFSFNASRSAVAAAALLPLVWFTNRKASNGQGSGMAWKTMTPSQKKTLFIGGICCGAALALGSIFQQLGLNMGTGAGKAGFITALYIVLVPLAGLFRRKNPGKLVWIAVVLSAAGLYFLCIQGGFTIAPSDLLVLICAACYTGHILVIDHFSPKTDCIKMSCIQFATTTLICAVGAALFEQPTWEQVRQCLIPILYAGLMSSGVGYTLQIIAQRDADPAVASLLMSLESVFAVLSGWLLLGDALSLRELLGCALMMGGIVLAQLPEFKKKG